MVPDLADAFEKAYGCPVLLSYGATEFTGGITGWSLRDWQQWKDTKRGSVGRTHPGVEISVIDPETEEELPPGQYGILQVRSAQAAGGDGQWVRTNDLGSVDEDGFVWIHGRADDVINRGGFKVFPAEIEDCLEAHPQVREAVAFGIPDERLGQVPVAVVVAEGAVSPDELVAWVEIQAARLQGAGDGGGHRLHSAQLGDEGAAWASSPTVRKLCRAIRLAQNRGPVHVRAVRQTHEA